MLAFYFTLLAPDDQEKRQDFETFYRKYRDVMYQAAFQVLNDRVTAEDAVHDAFLSILDHIHKIDLFG